MALQVIVAASDAPNMGGHPQGGKNHGVCWFARIQSWLNFRWGCPPALSGTTPSVCIIQCTESVGTALPMGSWTTVANQKPTSLGDHWPLGTDEYPGEIPGDKFCKGRLFPPFLGTRLIILRKRRHPIIFSLVWIIHFHLAWTLTLV